MKILMELEKILQGEYIVKREPVHDVLREYLYSY